MQAFFKDIFAYHNNINQLLMSQMQDNASRVSEYANGLFSHTLNAHQIWNSRILNEIPLGVNDIHTLQECIMLNKEIALKTIHVIENRDLRETVLYKNTKGIDFENTVQQILFHISNHYAHHRGQLISDLKKNGITPIISDYIFHRRTAL